MTDFHRLTFGHSFGHTCICLALPSQITCWYLLGFLANNSDDLLFPQGLAGPQVAQVLVNYWACIKHIFANSQDYPNLPKIHQSLATWGGTFLWV